MTAPHEPADQTPEHGAAADAAPPPRTTCWPS